ncbi:hypothetical protein GE061_008182 [Apolygus lucorum]|uniref:Uncharacterized protein n=1 Tax=Apolygus lucorum TaxID=248454 RepID=A0A6A4ISN6_APOLU|nr:hypothetical protein GE061_008182 [Apolygus lucorum]
MGKRGTVSENKLNRIRTDIQTECNKTILITVQEVEVFYRELGNIIDHTNAQVILTGLSRNMANFSLRLRLTVDQAIKGGMTSYWSIHAAFEAFPNFPWATARRYLELDFTRFQTACALVGNNIYYGFNSNSGEAAAPRYKSLSWLCMHLLVRHLGAEYGTLTQYATYNRAPDHQAQLQALIDAYVPVIPDEDAEATQELLNTFRNARLGPQVPQ